MRKPLDSKWYVVEGPMTYQIAAEIGDGHCIVIAQLIQTREVAAGICELHNKHIRDGVQLE